MRLETVTVALQVATWPFVATARTLSVCAPFVSFVVSHVPPSPLNVYGADCSVQRSLPSTENSTRSTVAPDGLADHETLPLTVDPLTGDDELTLKVAGTRNRMTQSRAGIVT